MDINRYFVVPVLVGFIFMNGLAPASDREGGLAPLLDKISKRMNSYPENGNWKYSVVTKTTEMDKQWRPKKTTITTANVKEVDNVLSGEILKAVETEDGITKDVTEKIAKQTKKQLERTNKERAEQKEQKGTGNEYDAFFPFNENKRAKFAFHRLDDADTNERPVYIIEAVAKEKDEQLYEGKFYIDQTTYDIIKVRIKPSKNPRFVKELEMDIDFEVLPEGKFIRRRSRTRVDGGLLFKRFRMIVEEEYFDIEILDYNTI
jgi:hypothetical protein